MSSRPGLLRDHAFKVRLVKISCLQAQACLEIMSSRSGLFRESGLFRGSCLKVRIVQRSCLQGQDCLEVQYSRSGLFRGHVFKVRIV